MSQTISFILKEPLDDEKRSSLITAIKGFEGCESAKIHISSKPSKSSLANRLGFAQSREENVEDVCRLIRALPEIESADIEAVRLIAPPKFGAE